MLFRLILTLLLCLLPPMALAVDCADVFPGNHSLAALGGSSIGSDVECNEGSCSPIPTFTPVLPFPTFTPTGTFNLENISDGVGYYSGWGHGKEAEIEFIGSGTAVLYFDGSISIPKETEINEDGDANNVLIIVNGSLAIGKEVEINAHIYATGSISIAKEGEYKGSISAGGSLVIAKEVEFEYSAADIDSLDSHGFCNSGNTAIDHYQIIHDGNGLTCDPEVVTIKACTNSYDGTCTLSADAVTLDVKAFGSQSVVDSIAFTGSTTATLPYTSPDNPVTLLIENSSIAAASGVVCINGASNSCNMVFADAGFIFSSISNQISGEEISNLTVQAVENNNGVCTGIFNSDVDVNLSQENIFPANSIGLPFQVDGNDIARFGNFSEVTLNFDNTSTAIIPNARYLDAGQIKLKASYSKGGVSLAGDSSSFWVKPDTLVMSAKAGGSALNATTATANPVHKSGQVFDFEVTAQNSLGGVTVNYQPGELRLSASRFLPNTGVSVNGTFTFANNATIDTGMNSQLVTLTAFSQGRSSFSSAKYSEVGIFNLDIQDINYAGQSLVINADDITVGRFTPDHFVQTVIDNGSFMSTCNLGANTFAYTGQLDNLTLSKGVISYLTAPKLKIVAKNADGNTTKNYYEVTNGNVNDFMHLTAGGVSIDSPTTDAFTQGLDTNLLPLSATLVEGDLSQISGSPGELEYQFSSNDHFVYTRNHNAFLAPFTARVNFQVNSITDGEVTANSTENVNDVSGVEIRFGRLVVANSYGPETKNLPQPLSAEYYDGANGWQSNTDDLCTQYSDDSITLTNVSLAPSSLTNDDGMFNLGKSSEIEVVLPGAGNVGQMGVEYQAPDWLKFDWEVADNLYDENPSAIATFGLFRGNDRIISWRELSN